MHAGIFILFDLRLWIINNNDDDDDDYYYYYIEKLICHRASYKENIRVCLFDNIYIHTDCCFNIKQFHKPLAYIKHSAITAWKTADDEVFCYREELIFCNVEFLRHIDKRVRRANIDIETR